MVSSLVWFNAKSHCCPLLWGKNLSPQLVPMQSVDMSACVGGLVVRPLGISHLVPVPHWMAGAPSLHLYLCAHWFGLEGKGTA